MRGITLTPQQGGRLASAVSKATAGPANYTAKIDWRRIERDQEGRSEGCDYFCMDPDKQYIRVTAGGNANGIYSHRGTHANRLLDLPDGGVAIINGKIYWEINTNGIITNQIVWKVVGNTSADGSPILTPRFEIIGPVGSGYGLLYYSEENVATPDLVTAWVDVQGAGTPVVESLEAAANHAFPGIGAINLIMVARRENGDKAVIVGSKTTICRYYENNGMWDVVGSGFSASGSRWEAVVIAGYAIFNNGVDLPQTLRIVEDSVTNFGCKPMYEMRDNKIASVGTIAEYQGILMCGDVRMIADDDHTAWMQGATPYGPYTGAVDRVLDRVTWSDTVRPTNFKGVVPASITTGTTALTLKWASEAFAVGDELIILGAGASGGNLTATITAKTGAAVTLSAAASTTVTDSDTSKSDSVGAIVAFEDIGDGGGAILKMLDLRGVLVIYKERTIATCTYRGASAIAPFQFERIAPMPNAVGTGSGEKSLFYRHTLSYVMMEGQAFHVYAGRTTFYRFDLVSRVPQEMDISELARDTFFAVASSQNKEDVFAWDNSITQEIWFCFPGETIHALRLDYGNSTFSQTTTPISAGGMIQKPGGDDDWAMMGTSDGVLLLYGLVSESASGVDQWDGEKAIWYRRYASPYSDTQETYDSTLTFGFAGDGFSEMSVSGWICHLASQSPDTAAQILFYGYNTPNSNIRLLGFKDFANLKSGCQVGTWFKCTYISDEIVVSGSGNAVFSGRTIVGDKINSKGWTRNASTVPASIEMASSSALTSTP